MKVHQKQGKVTQNMHGASRNYRYVWDVSAVHFSAATIYNANIILSQQYNSVNCLAVICSSSLAILLSFGRETSLVNITGPLSIFPPLFTPSIYFQLLLYLALILCKQQGRRN